MQNGDTSSLEIGATEISHLDFLVGTWIHNWNCGRWRPTHVGLGHARCGLLRNRRWLDTKLPCWRWLLGLRLNSVGATSVPAWWRMRHSVWWLRITTSSDAGRLWSCEGWAEACGCRIYGGPSLIHHMWRSSLRSARIHLNHNV